MINITLIEDFRTKEELVNYFKENNIDISDEEIQALKVNYREEEKNNNTLNFKQLEEVSGGVLFIENGRIVKRNTEGFMRETRSESVDTNMIFKIEDGRIYQMDIKDMGYWERLKFCAQSLYNGDLDPTELEQRNNMAKSLLLPTATLLLAGADVILAARELKIRHQVNQILAEDLTIANSYPYYHRSGDRMERFLPPSPGNEGQYISEGFNLRDGSHICHQLPRDLGNKDGSYYDCRHVKGKWKHNPSKTDKKRLAQEKPEL